MKTKIKKHIEELHIINSQRKGWLVLSAFVAVGLLGIIFGWNAVQQYHLVWLVVGGGLIISMIWWYWTMRLITHLIHYKVTESEILIDIVQDIRMIKDEVRKTFAGSRKE
jgi:ABC-type bacteriocin/lantibiotic exporter with double-glycine peptidase domain